jgi:hypothetical protein
LLAPLVTKSVCRVDGFDYALQPQLDCDRLGYAFRSCGCCFLISTGEGAMPPSTCARLSRARFR